MPPYENPRNPTKSLTSSFDLNYLLTDVAHLEHLYLLSPASEQWDLTEVGKGKRKKESRGIQDKPIDLHPILSKATL